MTVEGELKQLNEYTGRIAKALEALVRSAGMSLEPKTSVTFGELRDFADARPLGRGRGQASGLWATLTSDQLAVYLSEHHLPTLVDGDEIDIAALKRFTSSEYFTVQRLTGQGIGESRFDLLVKWVASL